MGNIEIGELSPEDFETGKKDDGRLKYLGAIADLKALYSWVSLQADGSASVYPSRIFHVADHEPTGLVAVRFAILSANRDQIRASYSLFDDDGFYAGQRNGLPFLKWEATGPVTVEEGYFRVPIETELAGTAGVGSRSQAS